LSSEFDDQRSGRPKDFYLQRFADPPRDVVLNSEDILPGPVVFFRPEQVAVIDLEELRNNPQSLTIRLDARSKHIIDMKFFPDLLRRYVLAFKEERRRPGRNTQAFDLV